MRDGREGKATLSDQSSIWHLESYRSLLISQMSREDLVSGLRICSLPEVFADPSVFSIVNYIRSPDEADEVKEIMNLHNSTQKPMRKKPLLDEFLRESERNPENTVCFTTNSNMIYNAVKLID